MTDQPFQLLDPSFVLLERGLLGEDLRSFPDEFSLSMAEGNGMHAVGPCDLASGLGRA